MKVQFADGNKMIITDSQRIERIVGKLQSIKFKQNNPNNIPSGVGYLYILTIKTKANSQATYCSDLFLNNISYQPNSNSKLLDQEILRIGRKEIPNLLPGAE
jgi:hypothetical protein